MILRSHVRERRYSCRICSERFNYLSQASRHKSSCHPDDHQLLYSCVSLAGCYDAAFCQPTISTSESTKKLITTASASMTGMTCGYCGKYFGDNQDSMRDAMIDHLDSVHYFDECNQSKFIPRHEFLRHLCTDHNIVRGNWTEFLFEPCKKERSSQRILGCDENLQINYLRFILPSLYQDLHSYVAGFPTSVGNYISLNRMVMIFQGQLALLNQNYIAQGSTTISPNQIESGSSRTNVRECNSLKKILKGLQTDLEISRKQCLQEGYSLMQIDQCLNTSMGHSQNVESVESTDMVTRTSGRHYDMFEIRKHTLDAGLLGNWSSTRDHINRWLLHSLRSDDTLAQLHRSMLTEKNLDEQAWARLLLKYWHIDEAAVGIDLHASLSLGAVDSRDFSSLESVDFYTCVESETEDVFLQRSTAAKYPGTEENAEKVLYSEQDVPEQIRAGISASLGNNP